MLFNRQVSYRTRPLSPFTSSISGEGITGSSGPSDSLSSLSLSGSGFNTKPVKQKTSWSEMDCSITGNATCSDSLTPETLQQLLVFCVIQTAVLPDVAFSLCSNLSWVENWWTQGNKAHCQKYLRLQYATKASALVLEPGNVRKLHPTPSSPPSLSPLLCSAMFWCFTDVSL